MAESQSHKLIGQGRALKVCDVCGGVDDHPRHAIAGDPRTGTAPRSEVTDVVFDNLDRLKVKTEDRRRLMAELYDTSVTERHMDCCRDVGCPVPAGEVGSCYDQTAGAEGKRGRQLLDHLMNEAR